MNSYKKHFVKDITKYIKNYKFNSIFVGNLTLLFMLIILPLTGVIVMSYYSYINFQKNEINSYCTENITNISTNLDEIINQSKLQLVYFGVNPEVQLFMIEDRETDNAFYQINTIYELLKMPILSKDYIKSIYIYSKKSNRIILQNGKYDYEYFPDKASIQPFLENNKSDDFWYDITTIENAYDEKHLSLYYPTKIRKEINGVVVINLSLRELGRQLSQSKIYITDNQKIIYSADKEEIGHPVTAIKNYSNIISSENFTTGNIIISSKTSAETGFTVISYLDAHNYKNKLNSIKNMMVMFIILMIVITVLLCLYISIKLYDPLKSIITTIEENKLALLGDVSVSESNELKYITNTIIKSADKTKDISFELDERIRLLKKAQSIALQSQINPHFFNNTLDTINWLAISSLGDKNDISFISKALSGLLRASLENTETFITIEQEIAHIQLYLEIQKKRYNNKFELKWDIDSELLSYKTIKIILQPIVENAIYHGMKPLTTKGTITVYGMLKDDIVTFIVSDDGVGMSEDAIMQLNAQLKADLIKENEHIGLSNVNQRLKLYFGEEFGITVNTNAEMGIDITLMFPRLE